jgi:AcrR family transcriptional regulator
MKSQKYEQLIRAAEDLFKKYGMKRVTVQEICAKAEVSKMTFYKHFKNKVDIAKTVINKIMDEKEKEYRILMDLDITYVEKAKLIVQKKVEVVEEFSQDFANDILQSGEPEIVELMTERTKRNYKIFISDFISAQKKGYVRPDIKPDFILYILELLKGAATDEHLMKLYDSCPEMAAELTNFFFYGVLRRDPEKEA